MFRRKAKPPQIPKQDIKLLEKLNEIQQIRNNLRIIIDFNELAYSVSKLIIDETYHIFNIVPTDPSEAVFAELLFTAFYELNIIGWVLSGIVKGLSKQDHMTKHFTKLESRYSETTFQIRKELTEIRSDISGNLNRTYVIPATFGVDKSTITVRELSAYIFPDRYSTEFSKLLDIYKKGFRKALVKKLIIKTNNYGIIMFEGHNPKYIVPSNPDLSIRCNPGPFYWNLTDEKNIATDIIINATMDMNWYIPPDKVGKGVDPLYAGNCGSKTVSGFLANIGYFNNIVGASYITYDLSHIIDGEGRIVSYYYFIANNYNNKSNWKLMDKTITDYLFIDDGTGKIINPDGIATREEVFRNWFPGGQDILPNIGNIQNFII